MLQHLPERVTPAPLRGFWCEAGPSVQLPLQETEIRQPGGPWRKRSCEEAQQQKTTSQMKALRGETTAIK